MDRADDRSNERTFELVSDFAPAGDQPGAIEALLEGISDGLATPFAHGDPRGTVINRPNVAFFLLRFIG